MEPKEALFYKKLKGKEKMVQCELCPHFCILKNGERGKCKARENQSGKLISLIYGKPCSVSLDPIEKKPFYHFYPGRMTLTLATAGCNLSCKHCQNWQISQTDFEEINYREMSPESIINLCKKSKTDIISFSYTEPTIFYEYMLDIAKLAKKQGIKCTIVSNGFINPKPLKQLLNYIDAFNIDLKAINEKFYKEICGAKLPPVLETIKTIYKSGKHLELTTLLIPGLNDSEKDIKKVISWIKKNLSTNVPIHFSAFYPCYKLSNLPPTNPKTVFHATELAKKRGMKNVHTGNI